jgi:sulfate adenylyltransferase subunit 1
MGRIESGRVSVGDKVVVLPAGTEARIKEIVTYNGSPATAIAPQSVTLLLDRQVDVSRGDLFASADELPTVTNQITANLAWLSTQELDPSRRYLIKHTTQSVRVVLDGIDFLLDVNTLERKAGATTFRLNDIGRVRLKTMRPLMVDAYRANRITGSFILIDEVTNQTVAGGMILGETGNV